MVPSGCGAAPYAETIQAYADTLVKSQKRPMGLFNAKDRTFPLPRFLIAFALVILAAGIELIVPFISQTLRSPVVDGWLTGRPYRLT